MLAHPPGDQLGILSAKIQNQNALRCFHKIRVPSRLGCRDQRSGATWPILPQNGVMRKGNTASSKKESAADVAGFVLYREFYRQHRKNIPRKSSIAQNRDKTKTGFLAVTAIY